MNMEVKYLEVCRFDPSQRDVNHVTMIVTIPGVSDPVTVKATGLSKTATTAIVNAAGLGAPKDTKRVGVGKVGRNKDVAWRVFAAGTKPEKGAAVATDEVDFE